MTLADVLEQKRLPAEVTAEDSLRGAAARLAHWCVGPDRFVEDVAVAPRFHDRLTAAFDAFPAGAEEKTIVVDAVRRMCLRQVRDAALQRPGTPSGPELDRYARLWCHFAAVDPAADAPATAADRVRRELPDVQFTATTYFPVWMPPEKQDNGAVVRLSAHAVPCSPGDADAVSVAPWSDLAPLWWERFAAAFGAAHAKRVRMPEVIHQLCRAVLPGFAPAAPERYVLEFAPIVPDTFDQVDFKGESFGFAALLAVLGARLKRELRTALATGVFTADSPGAVDQLRPKVRAAFRDASRLTGGGRIPFFVPAWELYKGDHEPFTPKTCDPTPTDVVAIERFVAERYGLQISERVELVKVGSWAEFETRLPDLFARPYDRYCSDLAGVRKWEPAAPCAGPDRVYTADIDQDPLEVALWVSGQFDSAGTPAPDRDVPVFLDLRLCDDPRLDGTGAAAWVEEAIRRTHRHHHRLPDPDPEGALHNRVFGRSRLSIIVFSAPPRGAPRPAFQQEGDRAVGVARYADPSGLPVAFVGNNSSHANMLRDRLRSYSRSLTL